MAKCARAMRHVVIAKEMALSSKLRVLQYSPCPMDTGVLATIRASYRSRLQNRFVNMAKMQANIRPEVSEIQNTIQDEC